MPTAEPIPIAVLLATFGVLMVGSVLLSRISGRTGVPVALIFLVLGMLAGSEGIGGFPFDDYALSFRIGTVALVLILFDGGLNTPASTVRSALFPAALLATLGVAAVAALTAAGARVLGLPWGEALLIGAIVSSTDAAAVFVILRGSGLHLKRRVAATLELESGLNDPMAVILTFGVTRALLGVSPSAWDLVGVPVQLALGLAFGAGIGLAGRALLARAAIHTGGLYPVLTTGLALTAFGVPTLFSGSGFLAVYVAGIILGNGELPYRSLLLRTHDFTAWASQVVMFLVLGLLSFPSRLREEAWPGVGVALFLTLVSRPLVVALFLAPFRYPVREVAYMCWVGLRGAVPIVLAIFPILAGAPGAARVFNVVFFVVVIGAIVPGSTIPWLTRRLGLERSEPPAPPAVLEVTAKKVLGGEVQSFYIDPASTVSGVRVADIPLPETAAIMLIVRGENLVPARGQTVLTPGDHVFLFSRPEDRALVRLIFGAPQEQ
jgi:cell volume regulation protein A